MSRNSTRLMLFAVILIASLVAMPAAATGPAHRAPTHAASVWSVIWNWATSLLSGSDSDGYDRGILIDPNGGSGR
jgi:hypothetical protein